MARPRPTLPVKLICGLLSGDADLLRRARQMMVRRWGPIDHESEVWPFTQTEYYREQMGENLLRQFVSFERLIRPDELAAIKVETNAIEGEIAEQVLDPTIVRPVNLDPGYVDLGKLVLATTKDRSHRIHIGSRIYAEVTLHYSDDRWQTWPWTYRDYAEGHYFPFLSRVREMLHESRRRIGLEAKGDPPA